MEVENMIATLLKILRKYVLKKKMVNINQKKVV